MIKPSRVSCRGSAAVACLERAWAMIRELQPCLPEAVIVLLPAARRRTRLATFTKCVWRAKDANGGHELAMNPVLFDDAEELLGTILHEAAHGLLFEWGLKGGCGPDGYYHREEFRNVCEKLGLECEFNNKRYGWNITRWPVHCEGGRRRPAVPARYLPVLRLLRARVPWGLR